jgi:polar amino acid transport system substrate-binding protein
MRAILVLFLLLGTLGYLGGEGVAQPVKVENQARKTGSTLQEVKARGKLIAGVTLNEPPLGFADKSGGFQGFYIDVAGALAKRILAGEGKVEFIGVPVEKWVDSLKSRKVDVLLAPLFISEDQRPEIDYSVPCFVSGGLILVKKDRKIRNYQELAGKSVAVIRGTTAERTIRDLLPKSKVVPFSHNADALQALNGKKVDAFAQLDIFVFYMEEKDKSLTVVDLKPVHPSPVQLGVRKGDPEWRDAVDIAMLEMMTTGEYRKLLDKWFGRVRGEFLDLALKKEIQMK